MILLREINLTEGPFLGVNEIIQLSFEWQRQLCTRRNYPQAGCRAHGLVSKPPTGYRGVSQDAIKLHAGKQVCGQDQGICGEAVMKAIFFRHPSVWGFRGNPSVARQNH